MENITVKDIVKATGGFLLCGDEDTPITGLCIDSRKAQPGDLLMDIVLLNPLWRKRLQL